MKHAFRAGMVLALLVGALPARAWQPVDLGAGPVRWSHLDVTFRIDGPFPAELGTADVEAAVRRGLEAWGAPECSAVRPALVSDPAVRADVVIRWLERGWTAQGLAPTAVGTTDITYELGDDDRWWPMTAEILLNAEGFRWIVARRETASGEADVQAVVAHEGAHSLLLAHCCERGGFGGAPDCDGNDVCRASVLYPEYAGISQRILSQDDVAAICTTYPSAVCGGGCPAGEECTAEGCRAVCPPGGCGDAGAEPAPDAGPAPPPRGNRVLGDPCRDGAECRSGLCSTEGYCTQRCSRTRPCPRGTACARTEPGGHAECRVLDGALGDSCSAPSDCHTGLCLQVGGEGTCTRECLPAGRGCPPGYDCASVDGRHVCRAVSTGCSVGAPGARSGGAAGGAGAGWIALVLLVVSSVARRRWKAPARVAVVAVIALTAVGCGGESHAGADAGEHDAGGGEDAGGHSVDAGDRDGGGAPDAGPRDAGPRDAGPEPCATEGAMRTAPCGNCGLRSEVCGASGVWEPASECLGEGECAPGAVERRAAEMCAEESRICDDACTWRPWSVTTPPGCMPGEVRIARGPCTGGGVDYDYLEQVCSESCAWTATGMCDDACEGSRCGFLLDPCSDSSECIEGAPCVEPGYCSRTCSTASHCPWASFACVAGVCTRTAGLYVGDACTTDEECGEFLRCLEGECTKLCSLYCPRGYACDRAIGVCRRLPDA